MHLATMAKPDDRLYIEVGCAEEGSFMHQNRRLRLHWERIGLAVFLVAEWLLILSLFKSSA